MSQYETGQPGQRAYVLLKDQHGRRWGVTTENKTRQMVGTPEPQFRAPFLAPIAHLKMDPTDLSALWIDYDGWLGDVDAEDANWNQALREAAKRLYGQGAVGAAIANPQPELLDEVGPKPKTIRREFVEAQQQGNKWALGLAPELPQWAAMIYEEEGIEEPDAPARPPVRKYMDLAEELATPKWPQWEGYGRWRFSNGELKKMSKEMAETYEAELEPAEATEG